MHTGNIPGRTQEVSQALPAPKQERLSGHEKMGPGPDGLQFSQNLCINKYVGGFNANGLWTVIASGVLDYTDASNPLSLPLGKILLAKSLRSVFANR